MPSMLWSRRRRDALSGWTRSQHGRSLWLEPLEERLVLAALSITVNSLDDVNSSPGITTLRAAIAEANANAGSTIDFDANLFTGGPGTIALGSALPEVSADVSITGPGASTLTVDGGGSGADFSIFTIDSAVTAALSGFTVSNGHTSGGAGAAVNNSGNLTITASRLSGNVAQFGAGGGAIYNHAGTVNLVDSTLSGNSAGNSGGAILNQAGILTLRNTTVRDNTVSGYGAGIFSVNGSLTLTDSSITGNTTTSNGGGLKIFGTTVVATGSTISGNQAVNGGGISEQCTMTLIDCTVNGNTASADGGGIQNNFGTLTISGSTLSGNTANGAGGGLANPNGTATLTNSTLTGNFASNGGGIYNGRYLTLQNVTLTDNRSGSNPGGGLRATVAATLFNTLIAGNFTGGSGTTPGDVGGAIDPASSFNLIGDGDDLSGISNGSKGNQIGTAVAPIDAKLGVLADNGGPTLTVALLAGSSAIDGGSRTITGVTVPTFDQRGAQRGPAGLNAGATVDIGAYEATSSYLVTSTTDDGNVVGTLRSAVSWANQSANANPANSPVAPNTIRFDKNGVFANPATITLTSVLDLTNTATPESIEGTGSAALTIHGGGPTSAFSLMVVRTAVIASISGVSLVGADSNVGAAIINTGNLTVTASTMSGNTATLGGGAVYNTGVMALLNSVVSGNYGRYDSGGIDNRGTLTVTNSAFTGNTSGGNGGGISSAGTLTVTQSTFSGNGSTDRGGAISSSGSLTVIDSTLSGNTASNAGGAIWNYASLTLRNTTLAGNTSYYGGGLYVFKGTVTATNVTIAGNRSRRDGVGALEIRTGSVTLFNTLVAGNFTGAAGTTPGDALGAVEASSSFNLIGVGDGLTGISNGSQGNQIGTAASPIDAKLGALADNGGPTQTVALLAGSTAIDGGSTSIPGTTVPTADQRGGQRGPQGLNAGPAVDIGAYEATSSFLVTSVFDDPELTGTLRDAVSWANGSTNANPENVATPAPNTIVFDTSGVFGAPQIITLLHGPLTLTNTATPESILGTGLTSLSIDGHNTGQVFVVTRGTTASLSGLKITGGHAADAGGGIENFGTLSVADSLITGNMADGYGGGGIFNLEGTITLTNTTLSNNSTSRAGGAIFNDQGAVTFKGSSVLSNTASQDGGIAQVRGTLMLVDSFVSGNTTTGDGGAIGSYYGSISAIGTTFSGNSANYGGAISTNGSLDLRDSTFSNNSSAIGGGIITSGTSTITGTSFFGNTSSTYGGAIDNDGVMTLTNSTIYGNSGQLGGGILNHKTLTITNSTVTANRAFGDPGGGIFNTGTLILQNTLVAGNFSGGSGTTPGDIKGAVAATSSFNLIGDGDNLTGISDGNQGNQIGTAAAPIDAKLEPLQNNGGPTVTVALLAGSSAIDRGSNSISGVTVPAVDQRGAQRGPAGLNAGPKVDIGAYEASSSYLVTSTLDDGNIAGTIRSAVGWADVNINANPANVPSAPNTIRFDQNGVFANPATITLKSTLDLSNTATPISVVGTGASALTFKGGGAASEFSLVVVRPNTAASISGVSLVGAVSNVGAAIINNGTLAVTASVLSGNRATLGGGAVYNTGVMALGNSLVSNNYGRYSSGGIDNHGSLIVTDSTFTGNSGGSGGISNQGVLTVTGSTFAGNTAGDRGGAITSNGDLEVIDSTLSGNTAANAGGAIWSIASVVLLNTTIAGNTSNYGGGLYVFDGTAVSTNATLTNNRSLNAGSGALDVLAGTVSLFNTLIAGNFAGSTGSAPGDAVGAVAASSAFNLIGDGDSLTGISNGSQGNQIGTAVNPIDAKLGALADNGGPTQTVALLAGSTAIDTGTNTIPGEIVPSFDQRGAERGPNGLNAGATVDIGAYEATSSYVVTSTSDDGTARGTLRTAVGWANHNVNANPANISTPAANTIEFDTAGVFATAQTITLADGPLVLSNTLTPESIAGTGENLLAISGNQRVQVFHIGENTTVSLSGLTISGGKTAADGGGIDNAGNLTLSDSIVSGNSAASGGGIANGNGSLSLIRSTVSGNSVNVIGGGIASSGMLTAIDSVISGNSAGNGGGLYNLATGVATLSGVTVRGNTSVYAGGGVFSSGTLTLTRSTVSGNSSGAGGGIFAHYGHATLDSVTLSGNTSVDAGGALQNNTATVTLLNSTVTGNSAITDRGGGISNNNGTTTVVNSTIAGNTAAYGGGIQNYSGSLTLTNVTLTANRASNNAGGGIEIFHGTVRIDNTLIAGNFTGTAGTTPGDVLGALDAASSFNLIGDGDTLTGITNGSQGNLIGTGSSPIDAKLGVLADNGGPTKTIALLSGSVAIDAGSTAIAGVTVPTIDQRGGQRGPAGLNAGPTVDIGAFEATSSYLVTSTSDDGDPIGTLRAGVGWANHSTNANPANQATPKPNTVRFDASGIFATPQTITLQADTLFLTNPDTAEAVDGTGVQVTISGGDTLQVFDVLNDTSATLTALTITHGETAQRGGALENDGILTVTQTTFATNTAHFGGGAIFNKGTLSLTDSSLTGNTVRYGGGAILNSGMLTISGTTFANNGGGRGGAIYNDLGSVSATNATFSSNTATDTGGAIDNDGGTVTLTGSSFSANSSTAAGGAISNEGPGQVTGTNLTFVSNISGSDGGGVANNDGTVTLVGSKFSQNQAANGGGGAISNLLGNVSLGASTVSQNSARNGGGIENHGTLAVLSSLVSGNVASASGGGLWNDGVATVTNSTIYGNLAASGGGAFIQAGSLTLTNATIAVNTASTNPGGGINIPGGTVVLNNSLIANNVGHSPGPVTGDVNGAVNSASAFNLITDGSNLTGIVNGSQGNIIGTATNPIDAKLGPLADNGGLTQTVALLQGSPGIDAGSVPLAKDPSTGMPLQFDQRGPGFPRVINNKVDIGAFELQAITTTLTVAAASGTYGGTVTLMATLLAGTTPLGGQSVDFHLGSADVGMATTNANGLATLPGVSLGMLGAGTYVDDVTAAFTGSPGNLPSSGSATLTVNKAPLTVTANNLSKVYGAPIPTLTYVITGFVNGDSPSVVSGTPVLTTPATAASHVAGSPYAIDVAVGGLSATNYDFPNLVDGALTVTAAPLTVTANNQTKVYGAALPTLTYTITGFVSGDTSSVVTGAPLLSTTATASSHVVDSPFPIDITIGTLAAADYTFSTFVGGSLTVTKAPLTVTANNQTKVYGAPVPALTYTITGLVNGDALSAVSGAPVLTTSATAASHVAQSPFAIQVAIGTLSAADYDFPSLENGELSVSKAPLTVTANNQTKLYGAAIPVLTASITGFVNGDTIGVVTGAPALSTTATATSHVAGSPYPIQVAVGTLSAADYSFPNLVPGALLVTPAALTISADNQTVPFGGSIPTLTASYAGLVNGDTAASLSTQPVLNTTATDNSPAGAYPITVSGASSSDYVISFVPGTLTVQAFIPPPTPEARAATAFVSTLYDGILNRGPEPRGLRYWLGQLQGGTSTSRVARAFARSRERRALVQSGQAPTTPVSAVYLAALRAARAAALGGLSHPAGLSLPKHFRPHH